MREAPPRAPARAARGPVAREWFASESARAPSPHGPRELRIELERPLVVRKRRRHALETAAIPVVPALQIRLIGLGAARRRPSEHVDLIRHQLHRERPRDVRATSVCRIQRFSDRPIVGLRPEVHFGARFDQLRRDADAIAFAAHAAFEQVVRRSSRPISLALFVDCLNSIDEVRAMTPSRPGHRRPICVIISSVRPSLKYSCVGSLLRFANGSTTSRTLASCRRTASTGGRTTCRLRTGCPSALDRRDEPVPAPVQRLDEPRIVGIVAERGAQPLDGRVQAVLEVDERACRPEALPELLSRHHFARPLEHHRENLERLILKPDADAALSQLARAQIDLEGPKSPHARRTSFEGQHRKREVYQPRAAFEPCHQNVNAHKSPLSQQISRSPTFLLRVTSRALRHPAGGRTLRA